MNKTPLDIQQMDKKSLLAIISLNKMITSCKIISKKDKLVTRLAQKLSLL